MSATIYDVQCPDSETKYWVILDHMNHGVTVYEGTDRDRASEIAFVINHELEKSSVVLCRDCRHVEIDRNGPDEWINCGHDALQGIDLASLLDAGFGCTLGERKQ